MYLATAKLIKMVPEHATKSHPTERDIVKVLFLANSYGAGDQWVAEQRRKTSIQLDTTRNYLKRFTEFIINGLKVLLITVS